MKRFLAIVMVISLSSVALGGLRENMWFNKGWKLHEKGNYKDAVVYFQKAAEQGHGKAQYQLGCCYLFSKGVPYDYNKAQYWLSVSMAQDYEPATMQIGFDALDRKDYSKAYAYFLHVKLTSKDAEWKKIADTALKAKHFTEEHRIEGRKGQKMIEYNLKEIRKIQQGS